MFKVEFSSFATKFLKKADNKLVMRLVEKIEQLSVDPFPTDVKRVVNTKDKGWGLQDTVLRYLRDEYDTGF